jgi:ABC-2 type transport system ATP-binding protein
MLQIRLSQTGKKFRNQWVFRNLDLLIEPGKRHVIVGGNGSGKSTLLLMLSGYLSPTQGSITWTNNNQPVAADTLYRHISMASPAMELVEEFTLEEMIGFHKQFKALEHIANGKNPAEMFGLKVQNRTTIGQFSSGMKQRLKLLLAMLSKTDLLLLDEPCTNLDAAGVRWYQELLAWCSGKTTVVIASNHKQEEYPQYDHMISL